MTATMSDHFTRAVLKGISDELNKLGRAHGCQPLSWTLHSDGERTWISGQAGADYADHEVPVVLAAWAHSLGLARRPPVAGGALEYRGLVGDRPVEVWGITDQAAFYASVSDTTRKDTLR